MFVKQSYQSCPNSEMQKLQIFASEASSHRPICETILTGAVAILHYIYLYLTMQFFIVQLKLQDIPVPIYRTYAL
jgi:hypothetical protein